MFPFLICNGRILREYGDYTQANVSFYEAGQPTYSVEHNRFNADKTIDHSGDVITNFVYIDAAAIVTNFNDRTFIGLS